MSRLSIPNTCFDLQYVRPDFIMLRVIAQNLIMWSRFVYLYFATIYLDLFVTLLIHVCSIFFCRVHPSKDWVLSQIPEVVRCGVEGLGGEGDDVDDMDAEAFVQAYVNVVAGACMSLGKMLFYMPPIFFLYVFIAKILFISKVIM